MDYILRGLTILIIIVLTNGILSILRKPVEASAQAVVLPKFLFWLGIIGAGFFVIPCIIILLTTESNWLILPFLAFSCLGASLIIAYCNCRIQYGETTFISKNFWGIKREYTYAEITAIRGKDRDVKVYLGKHRVRIDQLAVGKYEFLSFAKKQYRKLHNGNPIPAANAKSDFFSSIFNGNVEEPGGFIIVYSLITVLCLGMTIFCLISAARSDNVEVLHQSLVFSRYEIQEKSLYVYVDAAPLRYQIPSYKKLLNNAERFLTKCDAEETFYVGYSDKSEARTPRYEVYSIVGEDGTVYLTAEAVLEDINFNLIGISWACGILFILNGALFAGTVYVGRHPERFSPRVIRLFFKPGYIKIPERKLQSKRRRK